MRRHLACAAHNSGNNRIQRRRIASTAASGVNDDTASYYKTISDIEKMDANAKMKRLRVGGDTPKQFRDWHGKPLIRHSVEALQVVGADPLVVVIAGDARAER